MPATLKDRIEDAATSSGRSINAEVIDRLQRSFDVATESGLAGVPDGLLLDEVIARYGARVQIVIAQDVADQAGIAPTKPKRKSK